MRILHLQTNGNIRTWKQAKVMADAGHTVGLCYAKHPPDVNLPGLSREVFSECSLIDMRHPRKWIAGMAKGYDVIHAHNDNLAMYARASALPVVLDVHDMASLVPQDAETIGMERNAVEGSNVVIASSGGIRDEIHKAYGIESRVVFNFPVREQVEAGRAEKLSFLDGFPYAVYAGKVGVVPHRNFKDLFDELGDAGIAIGVYAANANARQDSMASDRHFEIIRCLPRENPLTILRTLSQYDCGLVPFHYAPHKRHLDSTMAHKFWDYLAAGLPVFTTDTEQYRRWFGVYPETGAVFGKASELVELIRNAGQFNVGREHMYTMESQIPTLEAAYYEA